MFGRAIEQYWGGSRFLLFCLVCGVSASLLQELVWYFECRSFPEIISVINHYGLEEIPRAEFLNGILAVRGIGGCFRVIARFRHVVSQCSIYLFFIPVPIKAKYFVVGYGLLELFFGIECHAR